MEAKVQDRNGIAIVNISGRLEMDKAQPLRMACLKEFAGRKVIFSLQHLNFVGSSGIKVFFQLFKDLKEAQSQIKIVGLKPDFQRLLQLTENLNLDFYDSIEVAINAHMMPPMLVAEVGTANPHTSLNFITETPENFAEKFIEPNIKAA